MSVMEPADSGGGASKKNLQVMPNVTEIGSWALMMAEEELTTTQGSCEDVSSSQDVTDGREGSTEKKKKIPDSPPFLAQVANISVTHDEEELLYYFGGEEEVKSLEMRQAKGNATFEFHTQNGLLMALQKHGEEFQGRTLHVYVQREEHSRPARVSEARFSSNRDSVGSRDDRHGYNRNNSRYNSQNSLNDGRHGGHYHQRDYRDNRGPQNNYNTMPANFRRGGGYNMHDRDGGYSGRSSFRKPFFPNNYGNDYGDRGGFVGELQRSESYHYEHQNQEQRPAPISARSRTESTQMERDNYSRASSRLSVNEAPRVPAVKKPSNRDIFGDAKPVDTQAKLRELEEKQKKREQEELEKQKEAQRLAAEQQHSLPLEHHEHPNYSDRRSHDMPPNDYNQQQHHVGYNKQRYDGAPGSVSIKKRPSVEVENGVSNSSRDSFDRTSGSHPMDPAHRPPIAPPVVEKSVVSELPPLPASASSSGHRKSTPSASKDSIGHSHQKKHVRPSPTVYAPHRGGTAPLQKSATMGQIGERRERAAGDAAPVEEFDQTRSTQDTAKSRGSSKAKRATFGAKVPYQNKGDRRSSFSGSEKNVGYWDQTPTDKVRDRKGSQSDRSEKKEHHGSQASLRSGQNYVGGRGRGRGRGRGGPDHHGKHHPPRTNVHTEAESKPAEAVNVEATQKLVTETKEVATKEVEASESAAAVITPSEAGKKKDKKKEKKKDKDSKGGKHLAGNKFAALLDIE
ncbi:unnamed protein product [Caenorhabditis auriculariae]|uniref:RRM domain-containing protein n=1 Tax=Caenorhabditis auriculariae TaxID=2777116 RepID=A0A8S1H3Z8_9PELO|nr:unnamed protein product [Caenorhabditis auriculariae]